MDKRLNDSSLHDSINKWIKKRNYKEIRDIARPNNYPWFMWSAKFSTYFAIFCLKLRLMPNQITAFWVFLGIIANLFLIPGTAGWGVVFLIIFQITWYLDFVDGDMARIISHVNPKFKQNILATWLDKFAYYIFRSLTFLCIGLGLFNITNQLHYLVIGFVTAYISLLDVSMKLRVTDALAKKNKFDIINNKIEYANKNSFIKNYLIPFLRPEPTSILIFAILFGFLNLLLYFYLILYSFYFFRSIFLIVKQLSQVYRTQ